MVTQPDATQRIKRLIPLSEALSHLDRLISPVAAREVAVQAAVGRTLAAPILAARDHPANALALRDGWALRSEATLDAGPYTPTPLAQRPNLIEVGDPLPADTDAVVPPDAVDLRAAAANALTSVGPGEGVLPRASDARMNEVILREGHRLSHTDVAALAAFGSDRVSVREPRIGVVPARSNDAVIDAIVTLIHGAVETDGAVATGGGPLLSVAAGGDIVAVEDRDAVIIVGGSGAGARDQTVHALSHLGKLAFHGVGLTPGETSAFGAIGSKPVLIVPGRLDAALAAFLVLGRPMVARLCSRCAEDRSRPAKLTRKISSNIGLAEFVAVQRDGGDVVPLAGNYISLRMLARADGWILVPPDAEGYPAGAIVDVRPLP